MYATFGPMCHLCEHPVVGGVDNGGQVDHLVAVCEWPAGYFVLENLRPVHGSTNRCGECGNACNQTRQARPIAYARRKVREPRPGYTPKTEPPRQPGRVWLLSRVHATRTSVSCKSPWTTVVGATLTAISCRHASASASHAPCSQAMSAVRLNP